MNAWLVRLSATENGSFFWDESCQELKCWKPALSSRQFYVPLALFQPHNRAPRISYLSASHVMQSCRHTKRGSAQLVIEGKKLANAFSFSVDFAPHLDPHLQRCIVAIVLSSVATVCQISSLVMRPLRHCGKKLLIVTDTFDIVLAAAHRFNSSPELFVFPGYRANQDRIGSSIFL